MLLIVEDDSVILQGLSLSLKREGWQILTAQSQEEALALFNSHQKELKLCLLDIGLPDGDGIDICRQIRQVSDTPVIFLTAQDDEVHTVLALEEGADDYITKPFRFGELQARIRAVLRRQQKQQGQSLIQIGQLSIDSNLGKVTLADQEILLTSQEYRLLLTLARNLGRLLTRQELLEALWDDGARFVNDNTLTVTIKRLRQKLSDSDGDWIETVRGQGYRLRSER
ncbi:response regulator transcription factor [Streptococcus hillyeri]|uniref:DNA-binding response regulator n=1 Tax=Streptococcus hillyeri TaxID=2282420 RepID=A0A3L9DRP7_9STRE|nr:response regulator transcription factor [Streptococcus hillyeri]RLY03224.1 DNA-binding response regulator [Streptococcus hillyeri]